MHEVDISTTELQIEGTPPSSLSEQEKNVESHASCSTPRDASLLKTRSDNDIGVIFKNAGVQTGEECQKVVDKLSDGAKYALLKQYRCPPDQLLLPRTFLAGCKRSFQRSWLRDYPWMVYSEELDGAFCISCALFCKKRFSKGQFVNLPFRNWHKKNEKCKEHQTALYHQEALHLADQFRQSIEHPEAGVAALISNTVAENIEQNRKILKCVADAFCFVVGNA